MAWSKGIGRVLLGAAATLAISTGTSHRAEASLQFTLLEQGADVVFSGGGTADTTDLTIGGVEGISSAINPSIAVFAVQGSVTNYAGLFGPISFGPGSFTFADTSSGDPIRLVGDEGSNPGVLSLPVGYVSGTSLSDNMTFDNATFASLGLTEGTYVWTWGSDGDADSLTLQIGPAAAPAPEPATLVLFGAGLAAMGAARRRRR